MTDCTLWSLDESGEYLDTWGEKYSIPFQFAPRALVLSKIGANTTALFTNVIAYLSKNYATNFQTIFSPQYFGIN
jgi:hypothetical protein